MSNATQRAAKAPRSAIAVSTYQAWVDVQSVHGARLEFVLDAAEHRNGLDDSAYAGYLWDMLKGEFAKSKTIMVREYQEYGDLSFLVQAGSTAELQRALLRSGKVVSRWLNKYHVIEMNPN